MFWLITAGVILVVAGAFAFLLTKVRGSGAGHEVDRGDGYRDAAGGRARPSNSVGP